MPHRVLLIEDSIADAVLLRDDLEVAAGSTYLVDHQVRLADGLAVLAREEIDIVLLDLSLPDSHGIDGLTRIQEAAPQVAVVVMTGLDDEEVGIRTVRMGAQDYLVKGRASAESVVRVLRYAIERKAAENQLRRFADAIVEHAPIGICVLRPESEGEFRVCAANTALAGLAGRPLAELSGQTVDSVLQGSANAAAVRSAVAEVRDTRTARTVPDVRLGDGPDARFVTVELYAMPDGLVGLALEDVTERHSMEAARQELEVRLQHAAKMESLGVLAGGIAHDFNNLLQVMLGNLELAMRELEPDAFGFQRIEQAREAAECAAELTRQMLVYAGRGAVEVAPLSVSELVTGVSHLLGMVIPTSGSLEFDLAPDMPHILGDGAQLRQAVMNLVTNAADAVDDGGTIVVRTGAVDVGRDYLAATAVDDALTPGRYAFIEVADQGCGMDEATRARIFDPFFTTKATGRGLGLASVLGIVRRHHGAVRVESSEGGGTSIRMLLPATDETRRRTPIGPQERPGRRCRRTILVVDDEPLVRELASITLQRQNYAVETACDGVEAVELFRQRSDGIDAVLLDLTMPRMNGGEAFKHLRDIRPEVPVILATGFGGRAGIDAVADASASAVLQKPYQPARLLGLLDELLGE